MGITKSVGSSGDCIIVTGTSDTIVLNSNTATVTINDGTFNWYFDELYKEEREIYGDELVDKFIKIRAMSIEEFAKSEFYRSLLNE